MFVYEKKLQYPINIKNTNPKLASLIISQYGGPHLHTLQTQPPSAFAEGGCVQQLFHPHASVQLEHLPNAIPAFLPECVSRSSEKRFKHFLPASRSASA